jgi:uncharacterized protein (DUF1778 family)
MTVEPKKRDRLHLRLASSDAALLKAAADRLDCSLSELVRRASVEAALRTLGREGNGASR